jgi:hypothetical protein
VKASRPARRGVGASRRSCSQTVISFGISAYLAIIGRRQGPYLRCRKGGGADEGPRTGVMSPRDGPNVSYRSVNPDTP